MLLALLGVIATYVIAPSQEVASQDALEEHQRIQDAQNAPVSIEDIYGDSRDQSTPNVASDEVLDDLDGVDIPKGPSENPNDTASLLPSPVPLGAVIHAQGAFQSGAKAPVEFTFTGKQNSPARIRDIRVRVTDRKEAPKGTLIFYPPQGNIPDLKLGFDLESDDTSARVLNEDGSLTNAHYFRENTVTLAKGEALGFNSIVVTADCACEYVLDVEFSDGKVLQIDHNGKPFFLAAYRDDTKRMYTVQYKNTGGSTSQPVLTKCADMTSCAAIAYIARTG